MKIRPDTTIPPETLEWAKEVTSPDAWVPHYTEGEEFLMEHGFSLDETIYVVVQFLGNKNPVGTVILRQPFFSKELAEQYAYEMEAKHNWIWRVVPFRGNIKRMEQEITADLKARGIKW